MQHSYVTHYVWIYNGPGLYTVGFYDPTGEWHAESDHGTRQSAASRVHYLNGGNLPEPLSPAEIERRAKQGAR